MVMSYRQITTAIPYMNSTIHIGMAMELIMSDVFARYSRAAGHEVLFMTGTDEHGVKIFNKAKELWKETMEMLDEYVAAYEGIAGKLHSSHQEFIRTTDQVRHWPTATGIWNKLIAKGDIYKKKYGWFYCEGCEAFVLEKELDAEGNCPTHQKKPTYIEEENYFFALSKYSKELERLIASDEIHIIPEFRKNETLSFLREGLNDVSFSRNKDKMPWGIPVPGDDAQVMYVWCDALTNYLSGMGYSFDKDLFAKYNPTYLHVIGKDIARFHTLIYMGMLLSADLPTSKNILIHEFVTVSGEKMSKSLGTNVSPEDLLEQYSVDAVRFYFSVEWGISKDIDYSPDRFRDLYNSMLANNYGNYVNRVAVLFNKYFPDGVSSEWFELVPEVNLQIQNTYRTYLNAMERFDLKEATLSIFALLDVANKYIDTHKPWSITLEDPRLREVLLTLVELLYVASTLLSPIITDVAKKVEEAFSLLETRIKDGIYMIDTNFLITKHNQIVKIIKTDILFERKV